ncbi:hypothetical protein BY996DRAFT_6544197 [Phakopsora pachyrhizi]|nr:hypothetical protein BY996DRAFT_6544197 [Phakopsora pachyrhizi]
MFESNVSYLGVSAIDWLLHPRFGKRGQGKGGAERRIQWILVDFEEEGVTLGRSGWPHWKEEEKLGGGARQGQSDQSRITGATGL